MNLLDELLHYKALIRNKSDTTARMLIKITNANSERSFSKLALVKIRLGFVMVQERLCRLTLMSIESDILQKLDFADIIKDFSARKTRKKFYKLELIHSMSTN